MSFFYKVYLSQYLKDGNVEKSNLGEIFAPQIKSFTDVCNLLEPNLASLTFSDSDKVDFLEFSIAFRRVDPDFNDFNKDF